MTVLTKITPMVDSLSNLFKRCFHKRNIIIISQRKVKHIPISGTVQFVVSLLLVTGICWASYSTGSFIAARSALKQQGQMLRKVANAQVDSSFHTIYPKIAEEKVLPSLPDATLMKSDNAELIARVRLLESKVIELKNTNEAIVQRVHEKTSGRIADLENIIKQTGLNVKTLKKEFSENKPNDSQSAAATSASGGPYIPDEMSVMPNQTKEMLGELDSLAMLNAIVGSLPLATPIVNAAEESPFGRRIDPINGRLAFHSGLDLMGAPGSAIHCTADGVVTSAARNGAYGNMVDIDHGFGVVTRYGHLSEILVHEGQQLKKGDVLGIQGSTGRSTGAHLHYEVRFHDQAMNPKKFLEAGENVF